MKAIQLVIGVILAGIGLLITTGTLLTISKGTSDYSLSEDLVGGTLLGLLPFFIGLYLCRKAMVQNKNKEDDINKRI